MVSSLFWNVYPGFSLLVLPFKEVFDSDFSAILVYITQLPAFFESIRCHFFLEGCTAEVLKSV